MKVCFECGGSYPHKCSTCIELERYRSALIASFEAGGALRGITPPPEVQALIDGDTRTAVTCHQYRLALAELVVALPAPSSSIDASLPAADLEAWFKAHAEYLPRLIKAYEAAKALIPEGTGEGASHG